MGNVISINGGVPPQVPQMEDNVFYDLTPPAKIQGKSFPRVKCDFQVPDYPNEYVVKGIPVGGTKSESFILRFTGHGSVIPQKSANQEGF